MVIISATMKNTTIRFRVWALILMLLVLAHLVMLFTNGVGWGETVAYSIILVIVGGFYELWQWLRNRTGAYRVAFGIGLIGILILGWANGAVGIIGSENNPANLMYGAVFAVILIGSVLSRLRAHGMAYTLLATACVQILIPLIAFFIWPAKAAWGNAGVIGVFILNFIFALVFVVSALLFRRIAITNL